MKVCGFNGQNVWEASSGPDAFARHRSDRTHIRHHWRFTSRRPYNWCPKTSTGFERANVWTQPQHFFFFYKALQTISRCLLISGIVSHGRRRSLPCCRRGDNFHVCKAAPGHGEERRKRHSDRKDFWFTEKRSYNNNNLLFFFKALFRTLVDLIFIFLSTTNC